MNFPAPCRDWRNVCRSRRVTQIVGLALGLAVVVPAGASAQSLLPTGRATYRTLPEVNAELQQLAQANPDRVKLLTLNHKTLLGRDVYGVEIGHRVSEDVGKPSFFLSGVHHAREWPTVEFTMEFINDLLANDGTDPRITALLEKGRVIAVPMQNPDGYDVSRRNVNNNQSKRKNCRFQFNVIPTQAQCDAANSVNNGVDNNRNYGPFWGGNGSSASLTASNHRGFAPFSEPENQNFRDLWGSRQIMVAVNQHTPDRRLLQVQSSADKPAVIAGQSVYDALTERLATTNLVGWPYGPWTEVYYEATSTAEQQGYYTYGTFGFTTESTPGWSGQNAFHPPYQAVIDNYFGIGQYPGATIRGLLLDMFETAVDPAMHSVIRGTAPAGAKLEISKAFSMYGSGAEATRVTFPVSLRSTMTVPASGQFEWHVNPSVRASQATSDFLDESWTLNTAAADGTLLETRPVKVARGEQVDLSLAPQGAAGGTVPAVLSLTVGAMATFGAFTPGLERTYEATASANVVSTAGDAQLTVSDQSSASPGHLVNGAFALAQPVQAQAGSLGGMNQPAFAPVGGPASPTPLLAYSGPISNDMVTLSFRQSIGSSEPLRTGTYGKTLTFTLSTTNP